MARDGGLVSTLDLLGDGLTLFVGPGWEGVVPDGDGSPPVVVERLDAIAGRGLGLTAAGALLVRPDGHPVALWNDEAPEPGQLADSIAAAIGSPAGRTRAAVRA